MGLFTKAVLTLARGMGLTDPRLYAYTGSPPNDSGESVGVDAALQIDTVWACVRLNSQTPATLPFVLYQGDGEGNARLAKEHSVYRTIHDRPNLDMTAVEFWESQFACLLTWGNAFSVKMRGSQDQIVGLRPLRPDCVSVSPGPDGRPVYKHTFQGKAEIFTEDDILHLKGFSLDGFTGLSPIAQAANNLSTARAAERSAGSLFRNGMQPSGFLKAATYLNKTQREDAKGVLENYRGAMNTGKVPLLEGGWEFVQITIPPEHMQLLQTRSFHVEQICRWFDTPPVLIGHHSSGQTMYGSGVEQVVLGWLATSLRSQLTRVEKAVTQALLTPDELRRGYYAEFKVEGLLRADSAGRAQFYASAAQNGWMKRNEIRAKENLPPDPHGDKLTVQSNLVPLDQLGVSISSGAPPPEMNAITPSTTGANIPGSPL
jgi:HK97 family phage portal protein